MSLEHYEETKQEDLDSASIDQNGLTLQEKINNITPHIRTLRQLADQVWHARMSHKTYQIIMTNLD